LVEHSHKIPQTLLYDNGCKLLKYIEEKSKYTKTKRFEELKKMSVLVDRFHFKSHNDSYCKQKCNPNKFNELVGVNTSVAEQINSWFSRYRFTKYMNQERFNFFLFIIFDMYNEEKISRRLT
jgi:hypothetical protein